MKIISILYIAAFIILSCQPKKTSIPETKIEKEADQGVDSTSLITNPVVHEITTASQKIYKVSEDKKSAGLSDITIVAQGFKSSEDVFEIKDCDPLKDHFMLDLNNDGYEELYLVTSGAGSGSYGNIYGYASNKDLSVTPVYVREVSENDLKQDGDFFGYMGHDSIYAQKGQLFRKFPVYRKGDANCCPSGGTKIIQYTLEAGEASWILEIKK